MSALTEVKRRRRLLDAARDTFEGTIVKAHAEGNSLRTIAEAAGLSHEQVRRILAK